jgi:hypothetical protein
MDSPTPILRLLEYCIAESSDEAWRDLLLRFSGLIRSHFARGSRGRATLLDEFQDWFPGYLFHRRKIQPAYRWLREKAASEPDATEQELEGLFCSYFAKIVVTAACEFHRELTSAEQTGSEERLAQIEAPATLEITGSSGMALHRAIAGLPAGLRVPLCLRFYPVRELESPDFEWIRGRSGWDSQSVLEALESARQANPGRKYPVGSELIGEITGHSPDANGKYAAVDQAIHRALGKLRGLLQGA